MIKEKIKILLKQFLTSQRGDVSVLMAVLILANLMIISFGISALLLAQVKMSQDAGNSVAAFYAADAGMEKCLYQARLGSPGDCYAQGSSISGSLGSALFTATVTTNNATQITIMSLGTYNNTNRKLEATFYK